MTRSTTLKGNPFNLEGPQLAPGDKAPDFKASKNLLESTGLEAFAGKTVVLSVVPSLDTPVCDIMARRFNEEAAKLGDSVAVVVLSVDLPPAQARWCGASEAKNVTVLSDYKHRDFARKYGVWVPELGVTSRAVFVVGPDGTLKHVEYVAEIADHPDYDAALAAARG
jgi:thiol peroxidase